MNGDLKRIEAMLESLCARLAIDVPPKEKLPVAEFISRCSGPTFFAPTYDKHESE